MDVALEVMVPVLVLISLSSRPVDVLCAPSYFPHQSDLRFGVIKGRFFPSHPTVEALPACLYPAFKLHSMITGYQIKVDPPKDSSSLSWVLPSVNVHLCMDTSHITASTALLGPGIIVATSSSFLPAD